MSLLLLGFTLVGAVFAVSQSYAGMQSSTSELRDRVDRLEKLVLQQQSQLEEERQQTRDVKAEFEGELKRVGAEWEARITDLNAKWEIEFGRLTAKCDGAAQGPKEDSRVVKEKPVTPLTETQESSFPGHDVSVRSDDMGPLEPVVTELAQRLTAVTADVQANTAGIQALKNTNTLQDAAIQEAATSVYVRWGRSVCPSSTQLVYSGFVGGSYYNDQGSAADFLCLTGSPALSDHPVPGGDNIATLYGAEYETRDSHQNKDPVCAVCRPPRPTTVMIPGTNVCQPGWTTEYTGFLLAGWHGRNAATEFICVDSHFESRAGSGDNHDGKLLYFTVTVCGSLPCGPYVNNKVVTCVVCSK